MGFYDDLAIVARDPAIMRLAERRAGSRELAQDAVQATFLAVSQVKDPERIADLHAFFRTALIREIIHQRTRSSFIPVEDIASAGEQGDSSPGPRPPESVEHAAEIRRLAQSVLYLLDIHREQLLAAVPGRSPDQRQYRVGILAAARAIFLLLVEGSVASADWNAVLRSSYSPWFAEAGLASCAADQRLSRGRLDVRMLLQRLVPRDQIGW
jgi:DNA-directed RNA polymerase specialized sigma24 family protein